jgi:hypothetical protein
MCSGSIEQHDLDQLEREVKQEEAVKEYFTNYKISFGTFIIKAPSPQPQN